MVHIPAAAPSLTIPPPLHPPPHPSLVLHHESTYHTSEYFHNRDHIRDKDSRYLSTYHGYRDRSPEFRGSRERRMSPYGRDRTYRDKYTGSSSPGRLFRGSPGKERDRPLQRISRENRISSEGTEKIGKFARYNSASESEDNEESEEEVEEEIEVTASESEDENEVEPAKKGIVQTEAETTKQGMYEKVTLLLYAVSENKFAIWKNNYCTFY